MLLLNSFAHNPKTFLSIIHHQLFYYLGYIVQTYTRRNHGVQGLQILVQGQHDPEFMEERIEAFLVKFRVSLRTHLTG